jgi:DNA-binding CsgD family transcriptional regulator
MFASTERIELAALWDELVAGTSKVESWTHGADSWSVVVVKVARPPRPSEMPRARDLEILEHALLCGVRKLVAVQVGLSCSSIAVIMQSCFQFMGLYCLPSRIPGLVVAAAHAHHHRGRNIQAKLRSTTSDYFSRHTVSVARPEGVLAPWLAPAELAVISLLIEGQTYAEIAQARQTSVRTVANQVASGFRRLSVSGRAELLCLLARWSLEPPEPPVRRPPSSVPHAAKRSVSRSLQLLRGASNALSPSLAT